MYKIFKIITEDITGIACEVLEVFKKYSIDIKDAKIFSKEIVIKINDVYDTSFIDELYKIKGMIQVREIQSFEFSFSEKSIGSSRLVGESEAINRVKKNILIASNTNSSVMILGESGTGKEVVAKEIVRLGNRSDKPFVSINCAALPDDLLESELFGYKKGAFTGAIQDKKGLFHEANGGTLFLDEVGEMGILMQAKLLRVLQEGKIRRLGSAREEDIDVRIICVTNRNLSEMIKKGGFREDLYYRLNVLPIFLPKLSERIDDIPLLVDCFISELNPKLNKEITGYTEDYISKLKSIRYDGNIRELKNIVERSMNICDSETLTDDTIFVTGEKITTSKRGDTHSADLDDTYELKERIHGDRSSVINTPSEDMKFSVQKLEKEIIESALRDSSKSIRSIAKDMNISHTTLINKCKKYNIDYKKRG